MKKLLLIISCVVLLFSFYCIGGTSECFGLKDNILNHQSKIPPYNVDFEVSGIKLINPASVVKVLKNNAWEQVIKQINNGQPGGIARFLNKKGDEIFSMHFYPGDEINSFRVFEISKTSANELYPKMENIKYFSTGLGLKLNMSLNEIVSMLGKYNNSEEKNGLFIIKYRINNVSKYPKEILENYNDLTLYFMIFSFKDNILVNIKFGFDYP